MAKTILGVLVLVLVAHAYGALPDGAPCSRDSACNNRCFKGTCTSEVGYGGICDYKWECKGALVCRDRKCVHKGGTKNRSQLKRDGAFCAANSECKNICIKDRCQSRVLTGGFCDRSDQCYGKLVCRNGKCQMKKGAGKMNGKKCKNNYECVNVCLAGYCRNARYFGQSCYKNIHCKEDLVCVDRACRSHMYTPKMAAPAAIPRPSKKKAPKPAPAPARARTPKTRTAQPAKVPVAAPAPEKEQDKGVFTKEGKTAGAQAAIQKSKEEKEKPATIGLLRSGPGAEKKNSNTRSNIMKFFFCMVHQDEC